MRDSGVGLAAISVDSRADSAAFATRLGATFPLLSDPEMAVIKAYGVAMKGRDIAVPSTFIIDRRRRVRWRYVGETQGDRPDNATLLRQVRSLGVSSEGAFSRTR